ncbi:MAG TPA: hypothetical protein VG894_01830 [Bauldia sp.]|nr:hypothetical protein [Bauldia sp.]
MRFRAIAFGVGLVGCMSLSPPALAAETATFHTTVAVPSVRVVDSSLDEATLKAVLAGDLAGHASELASLNARRITIPTYDVAYSTTAADGATVSGDLVFHDIRLSSVWKGVANTVSIGSVTISNSAGGQGTFGRITAEQFDIGGLLSFYGLVPGDPNGPPRPIYRNLREAQGSIKSPTGGCDIGDTAMASLKARPLKMSFVDFMNLIGEANDEGDNVSPETGAKIVAFLVDATAAIEASPIVFAGLKCSGADSDGKRVSVGVGPVRFGAFANGRYPDISVQRVRLAAPGDGQMSLSRFLFKGMDFSGALAALKAAGPALDKDWVEAHYRELIPTFGGFAFSGFNADIPDDQNPGQRIQAAIGSFDLTLGNYINGIPTDIASNARHIVVAIPPNSSDEFARSLLNIGIDKVDAGYDFALRWDEPSQEIRLDKLSVSGADLGSLAVAAILGNATRSLFSTDTGQQIDASEGLTLKSVAIDMRDLGLANIVYGQMAARAGQDVKAFRQGLAALAQGTALVFLGGAANSTEVTQAIGDFINGAKTLAIRMTSKDPAGVTFDDFIASQNDPTAALSKVNIEAHAK